MLVDYEGTLSFNSVGVIPTLYEMEAVGEAVSNIARNVSGEAPMVPDLFGNFYGLVHEDMDSVVRFLLRDTVRREVEGELSAFGVMVLATEVTKDAFSDRVRLDIAFQWLGQTGVVGSEM
jgi:hypothetical protein